MSNNQIKQSIEVAARNVAMALISDHRLAVVAYKPSDTSSAPTTHDIEEEVVRETLAATMIKGDWYGDGSSVGPEGEVANA